MSGPGRAGDFRALVLAGRRGAADHPLARARGTSHRALLDVGGAPMLLHVVRALRDSRRVGSIWISIDDAEVLDDCAELAAAERSGALRLHRSLATPATSAADALGRIPPGPVLVTTADHALLTGARVDRFLDAADAGASAVEGTDLGIAVVERSAVTDPDARNDRTWIRLRDGAWTGANLFAFRTARARRAAAYFARAEDHRKRPWKLLAALAPGLGLAYLTGRLDLETAFARISSRAGVRLRPVPLADAEAVIDVDTARDLARVEAILARRESRADARGAQSAPSGEPSSGPREAKPPVIGS